MESFKKYIFYTLLIFLILNIGTIIANEDNINASSSSSSANSTTPTPTTTPVTTPSSKPSSNITDSSSSTTAPTKKPTTNTTSSEDSSENLHPCGESLYDGFSSSDNFVIEETDTNYNPYKCMLQKSNVVFSSSKTSNYARLTLDDTGCPTKCQTYSYSCAEIQTNQDLSYGTYEITLAASPVKNVNTKIYISSGGQSQYSDIFFLINGNSTLLYYGYTYFGQNRMYKDSLTGADFSTEQKYKFIYNSGSIIYYFNNKRLQTQVEESVYNSVKIPLPPMKFSVSITNDASGKVPAANLPTYSQISSFNYTADLCSSEDSSNDWNPSYGQPMYYFTSNCTNYRPIPIFNDSFNDGWTLNSNCLVQYPNSSNSMAQYARIGTSLGFALNDQTNYFMINYDSPIPIKRHKYLMFWINGGNLGYQSLSLYLTYKNSKIGSINISDLVRNLQKNTWHKAIAPMTKFIINPPTIKSFDGILIQGTSDAFLDMIYMDDLYFSNGTVCLDESSEMPFFHKGLLMNGAKDFSNGNAYFNSSSKLFRGFKTIEYQVWNKYSATIGFINGTIDTSQYDLMKINFFYIADPSFQANTQDDPFSSQDADPNTFPLQLSICATVQVVGALPCMGLSEYLGGNTIANKWVELLIPFNDLYVYPNAQITSFTFKSNADPRQGAFFIGDIQTGNFVPPHVDDDESSSACKLYRNFNLFLLLSVFFYFLF